jgi:hypothetical protein
MILWFPCQRFAFRFAYRQGEGFQDEMRVGQEVVQSKAKKSLMKISEFVVRFSIWW